MKTRMGVGALLLTAAATWTAWTRERPDAAASAVVRADAPSRVAVQGSFAPVVARVAPAVVTIRAERMMKVDHPMGMPQSPFEEFFGRRFGGRGAPPAPERREGGLGSGVIVSGDGTILTNHHVIDGARRISAELKDGRSFNATLVGSDAPSDLAVLKVEAKGLPTLAIGDSDAVQVGDVALAVGNPLGIGQTVTMGIVSAKGRATGLGSGSFEDFIQTDAPINRGNSGGALVNAQGELIGINSQILSPSGGSIGIGFAIPSNMARGVMDQLVRTGSVRRGMLGVTVQPVDSDLARSLGLPSVRGALVSAIQPGSPAEKAGLRRGDVIVEMDGRPVADSNALRNQVAAVEPGRPATFKVWRERREKAITAQVAELPAKETASESSDGPSAGGESVYGMSVQPLTPDLAERFGAVGARGVVVVEVDRSGAAAEAGLAAGDVIEEVDGRPVTSAPELRSALGAAGDRPALVLLRRGGDTLFLTLSAPRAG